MLSRSGEPVNAGINTSDTMDGCAGTAGNPTARRSWDKEPSTADGVSILAWVSLEVLTWDPMSLQCSVVAGGREVGVSGNTIWRWDVRNMVILDFRAR